jgi:hypothetical protein
MRVHIHGAGEQGVVTHPNVEPDTVLRELLVIEAEERVYRVGDEEVIDIDLSIGAVFSEGPGHVVTHPCREIAVTVGYAGHDAEFRVHPSTRVKDVQEQAIDGLQVDAGSAADLVLRLPGAAEDLNASAPIGSYVPGNTCSVTIDLIHAVRSQG